MAGFRADYAAEREVRAVPAAAPGRDLDRTISHLLMTAEVNAGHLDVHASAAAKSAGDKILQAHHVHHASAHAGVVCEHLAKLRVAVSRRCPGVAAELDGLDAATPGLRDAGEVVPGAALEMSIAHDLASAQTAAGHVERHLDEAAASAGDKASVAFNLEHAAHHIAEIAHSLEELDADLCRRLPAVAGEKARLALAVRPPVVASGPDPRSAGGDYEVRRGGPQPA